MNKSPLKAFNDAWDEDGSVITLVPYRWDSRFLEGKTSRDKDIISRATFKSILRSEAQYDDLLKIVSEWGFCVETPADFEFSSSNKKQQK